MLDLFSAIPFTPQPCRVDCKPKPDGTPATGWALVVLGALGLVAAVVILVWASRKPSEPSQGPDPVAVGGGLAVAGLVVGVVGLLLVNWSLSDINDHKKELRQDASQVVYLAVTGPVDCRWRPDGNPYDAAIVAKCDASPRSYAKSYRMQNIGGILPIELVFSPEFTANGEITVHEKLNDRSMCARIPDTDVIAAAHRQGPEDPMSQASDFDTSPWISPGACPDAPVVGY